MATEIVTQTWCDRCLMDDDKRTPATRSAIVALDGRARAVDLCEECTSLLEPVSAIVERYGVVPNTATPSPLQPSRMAGQPPSSRVLICPVCHQERVGRSALLSHLSNVHKLGMVEASRRMGGTEECPECGFMAIDKNGLSVHLSTHDTTAKRRNRRKSST